MRIQGGDQIMAQGRWPRNGPIEQRGGADSVQVERVGPLVGGNAILHHLGFVVSSISAVADEFAVSISARWDGEIIHDPIQRAMIRRETFNQVGLLDENLFMYGDDVDWCRRCWKAGWQVVFFPGARAIHDRGKTTAPYPVRFAVAQQRSVLYYWRANITASGA